MSKVRQFLAQALGPSWTKLTAKDSASALVRYQYKSFNKEEENKSLGFVNRYYDMNSEYFLNKDEKFDPTNKYHEDIVRGLIYSREKIKYEMQQLYGVLEPEKQAKIDQRQIEMYGKKTEDPAISQDFKAFSDKMLEKLHSKDLTIEEIIQKSFTSGGKNIVQDAINEFASNAVAAELEANTTQEDVIRQSVNGGFLEEPTQGIDECIYQGTSLGSLSEDKLIDAYADKMSLDTIGGGLKASLDPIAEQVSNKVFDDSISTIDDINTKTLDNFKKTALDDVKTKSEGAIVNAVLCTISVNGFNDKAVVLATQKVADSVSEYLSAKISRITDSNVSSFLQSHSGELQEKLVELNKNMSDTQEEIDTKKAELQNIEHNPDPNKTSEEIQEMKDELNKEISAKEAEMEKDQGDRDILDPSQEDVDRREKEYEDIDKKTWNGEVEHPVYRSLLAVELNENETATGTKKILDGNYVSQLDSYLINIKSGAKGEEISNSIDVGYRNYVVNGASVDVLIVEEIFEDYKTVIETGDQALLGEIIDHLGASG